MDKDTICQIARDVIEVEAETISQLATRINENFSQACQIMYNCKGRIVVTGVGKSGHIGKKIAATLASTGSPAFFVHPSEAKHGDIGMITSGDVVLALSNSGESEEVLALLPFLERFNIPLITLTGKGTSTLAKAAAFNLDVSVSKEACPLGLAPTASATAALVMGDALAMVLMDMRGFTKTDFAISHPGGSLGKRLLLKVTEVMHDGAAVPSVTVNCSLKEALLEMTQKKLGVTTIVDQNDALVGIFTDGDVRRALDHKIDIHNTPIEHMMSKEPKTISSDILAADALSLMQDHKITSLVVTNSQKQPIGIVHIHDILRAGISDQ